MDKLHFDDLTKITCPPGMLDDDTFGRLRAWSHGWKFWDGESWYLARDIHLDDPEVYRAMPADDSQDVIPWDALADWVQWVARDYDGLTSAYEVEPEPNSLRWGARAGKVARICDMLKGYQLGTEDWKYSLQKRPEGV